MRDTLETSAALRRAASWMDTTNHSHQHLPLRPVSSHCIPEFHVCRKSSNGSMNQEWADPHRQYQPTVASWNIPQLKKLNSFRMFAAISLRNRCSRLYVQSPRRIIIVLLILDLFFCIKDFIYLLHFQYAFQHRFHYKCYTNRFI